jgi:hypothetical protein
MYAEQQSMVAWLTPIQVAAPAEETPAIDQADNPRLDKASPPCPKWRHPTPDMPAKHNCHNPKRDLVATMSAIMPEREASPP